MVFIGKVLNGTVKLPPGVDLPDGTAVELILPESAATSHESSEAAFVLRETANVSETSKLPDDLAVNHDYYLHGGKKQQPRIGRWIPVSKSTPELTKEQVIEFTDKLLRFAAETSHLPPDLSENHNHYLHGWPKT
jgi:hypothetical protein